MRKTAIAAIAGAGLMLAASQTHAVIVFSGPVSLPIPTSTNGLYVNVVTGATNLPPPGTAGSTVPGWDINPWNTTGLGFFSAATPAGGTYAITAAGLVTNQASGALIGPGSTFGSGTSTVIAQWNLNSSNNYFGFRFTNESTGLVHYGWAQFSLGATIADPSRSILGYAYESVGGVGIASGSVGAIPEPSSYALMGLGVAGLLLARKRFAA